MSNKKSKEIIFVLILATGAAFALYTGIIGFLVHPYVEETFGSLFELFNFYEDAPKNAVLFLGSSQVREALDAKIVEKEIENIEIFNLGFTGDLALRRITELKQIKESKPKVIFIGISLRDISPKSEVAEDHLLLVANKIELEDSKKHLFTERQLELIESNKLEQFLYKRKFIPSSLLDQLQLLPTNEFENNSNVVGNFKDPFFYTRNQTIDELTKKLETEKELFEAFIVDAENNQNKAALVALIDALAAENITLAIVDMPIHPLLRDKIPAQSLKAYNQFLDENLKTNREYYIDLREEFDQEEFLDLTHLNTEGKKQFSAIIAKTIEGMV